MLTAPARINRSTNYRRNRRSFPGRMTDIDTTTQTHREIAMIDDAPYPPKTTIGRGNVRETGNYHSNIGVALTPLMKFLPERSAVRGPDSSLQLNPADRKRVAQKASCSGTRLAHCGFGNLIVDSRLSSYATMLLFFETLTVRVHVKVPAGSVIVRRSEPACRGWMYVC